jgi:hypothetical protein
MGNKPLPGGLANGRGLPSGVEASVAIDMNERRPNLDTLAMVIARSQIVWPRPAVRRRFPAGFEKADIAILDWIAGERRRAGYSLMRM